MQFVYLSRKKLLTSQPLAPPKSPSIDGSFDHFSEPQRTFVASTFSGSPASAQMSLVTAEGTIFLFTSVQVGQGLLYPIDTVASFILSIQQFSSLLQLDRFHSALEAGDLASLVTAQGEISRRVVELDTAGVAAALSLPAWGDQLGLLLATGQGIVRPDLQGGQGGHRNLDMDI